MTEWYCASDLAALPGVPTTERRVRARAERDGWQTRERTGRGGGREYHISSLPDSTRRELLVRARRAERSAARASGQLPTQVFEDDRRRTLPNGFDVDAVLRSLNDRQRAKAAEQVALLLELEDLVDEGESLMRAYDRVASTHDVKERTLRHWYGRVQRLPRMAWAAALADQRTGCAIERAYDDRIYQDFRDRYLQPRAVASKVYTQTVAVARAEGWGEMPSLDTLMRHLKKREDARVILLEREGPKALRDAMPHMKRDVSGMRALECLTVDGHYVDLLVDWPGGEVTRACLIAVQDVYSRAYVGWHVAKAETAHDVRCALLHVISRWGIPGEVRFDNTFAASAIQNTGGAAGRKRWRKKRGAGDGDGTGEAARAELKGVLPLCGIKVGFTLTAHGQSKPVERTFKEIAEQVASWPGFRGAQTGPNTQAKPFTSGERTVPIADVIQKLEHFIALYNQERGRRGGVANGRSYHEVLEQSYQAHAADIARPTIEQLRLLALVPAPAKIRADGQLVFRKNTYWSEATLARKGEEVIVRYDITGSLHDGVWLYTRDGAALGHVPCQRTDGFRSEEAAREVGRSRQQENRFVKKLAKQRRITDAAMLAAMVPLETPLEAPLTDIVRIASLALPGMGELRSTTGQDDAQVIALFGAGSSAAPLRPNAGSNDDDDVTAAILGMRTA